jgi:hypothetical protein
MRTIQCPSTLLIATNTDGVKERVGCTFANFIYCMQDGEQLHLNEVLCLAMLKEKLQLQTIRLG